MNNVLDLKGYRFFQASYDTDEKGTVLSVNRDVAGRNITYTGYILLAIGFILCFTGKNFRLRQLTLQLKRLKNSALLMALGLLALGLPAGAQNPSVESIINFFQQKTIDPAHAARFGALPQQSIDGRIEPVNTFSSEVLRKLHHSDKIGTLNSDRFLLSMLAFPEMWMQIPFISVKNEYIVLKHDLHKKQCAYAELFDAEGKYKLQNDLNKIFEKTPAKRSKFDKDLIKLNEQITIFYQLVEGERLNLFPIPGDPNHKWQASDDLLNEYLENVRSALITGNWTSANRSLDAITAFQEKNSTLTIDNQKIEKELLYNRLNIFQQCKKIYLIAGGLLLILTFFSLFRKSVKVKTITFLPVVFLLAGMIYHLLGIVLRWYIAGYAPWSNAYETMVYVSFVTLVAGLLFIRQSAIIFALSALFGGVILFVSGLNWMDPQITPLVPVLKSPWLMIHVAVIVAAYGFFGIGFLLGITNLGLMTFNRKNEPSLLEVRIRELTIINEIALWIGLALMTAGTFVGAVWANESWGRYWGWDPKETWALITILVYVAATHLRLVKKFDNPKLFNALSIIAFFSVLMTYFGVNYYLTGMHSYGG
jgi:cytochrome c-type biogenesis protein CcsB